MENARNKWKERVGIALYAILGIVIGCLFSTFVMQRVSVNGASMEPTYYDEDQLLMKKQIKNIQYGDIIVLKAEYLGKKDALIKRVIGCPGDTIDITVSGDVLRNGELLNELYIKEHITHSNTGEYTHVELSDNEYYVMGDNRNASLDSRILGPVKRDDIIGIIIE